MIGFHVNMRLDFPITYKNAESFVKQNAHGTI